MVMRRWGVVVLAGLCTVIGLHPGGCAGALAPSQVSPIAEPYAAVSGGAFDGPAVTQSPDPMVRYRWTNPAAATGLEYYLLRPAAVTTDAPGAFQGVKSLTQDQSTVTVSGPGSIRLDFGTESAAWPEFDSPDCPGQVEMSVSEFNDSSIENTTAEPKKYGETYRLETNKELYEGVRFAWIHVRQCDKPWHITGVRLVCQVRPTNYEGSFDCSDPLLTRAWYTGAYTVKLNLLKDYFGAILMNRGDRISWTGDAHVAQAASLAAFGNWDFVKQNLARSANDSNGIESYSLYWVLSLLDYYWYTGDSAALNQYMDNVKAKLDHGAVIYANPPISFYGWDERLGAGFETPQRPETQNAYRMLFIRVCQEFARAAGAAGRVDLKQRYLGVAQTRLAELRGDPEWTNAFGLHAAADAISTGLLNPGEKQKLYDRQFQDRVARLSYSPFNEYFVELALARMGKYDDALESAIDCWGGQIRYGGTSFFEVYVPSWNSVLGPNDPIPNCQAGWTSLCHPWSAGVTAWLTQEIAGIKPVTPGFDSVEIMPHFGAGLTWLSCAVPTPHGAVRVRFDARSGQDEVTIPPGVTGRVGVPALGRTIQPVKVNGQLAWDGSAHPASGIGAVSRIGDFIVLDGVQPGTLKIEARYAGPARKYVPSPQVYPIPAAREDTKTSGNWGKTYGRDGHVLFCYDGPKQDRVSLPDYVESVKPAEGHGGSCERCQWAAATEERRALAPSADAASPRSAGTIYGMPTMSLDVAAKRGTVYQLALYFLDWDDKSRRVAVEMFDLDTLKIVSPVRVVGQFKQGKYLVYRCDRPVRIRVQHVRGDNAVLSGLFFDPM